MSQALWPRQSPPRPGSGVTRLGLWSPTRPADVTTARLQLSAALHDGARPVGATEGAVEALLLAFEELVSNGLRHGRGPVEVTVITAGHGWLLEVADAAADAAPTPAVGRDPALGGLGLYLVAQLSAARGWTVDAAGRKIVWARVEFTRAESPARR